VASYSVSLAVGNVGVHLLLGVIGQSGDGALTQQAGLSTPKSPTVTSAWMAKEKRAPPASPITNDGANAGKAQEKVTELLKESERMPLDTWGYRDDPRGWVY
jgi:hypothetical protein